MKIQDSPKTRSIRAMVKQTSRDRDKLLDRIDAIGFHVGLIVRRSKRFGNRRRHVATTSTAISGLPPWVFSMGRAFAARNWFCWTFPTGMRSRAHC